MAVRTQNESDIKNLSGLQGIRQKASMYLGDIGNGGMFTAVKEVLDNCVDEASAGRNKLVHLFVDPDNAHGFWILDSGGGMPVGNIKIENPLNHKMESISALKALVSLTHSGGKFDATENEEGMRGTHGVGIKATNAVSDVFHVWTCRAKQWYETAYSKGRPTIEVRKCAAPTVRGLKVKTGTLVYVKLDPTIFIKGSFVDITDINAWFVMTASFSDNLTLRYTDADGEVLEWECTGPATYAQALVDEYSAELVAEDAKFTASGKFWNLALCFTDYDGVGLSGFTSGLYNRDGGTHVSAVYDALCAVVSPYAKRGTSFNPTDLRDGLVGAINVKLAACQFHNQEKAKLVDERAGAPLRDELIEQMTVFFAKQKGLAALLCERASNMAALKQEFKKNKRVMKVLKDAKRRNALPNKLASSLSCTAEERELFLVEGDSAGGSAKKARNHVFQEVLPLKGKIPNAFGTKASVAIENPEVLALLTAIGYDPSLDEPFENLRVGKVILLMDSDVDGLHIQNLCLAALLRFVPQIFTDGRVFLAQRYEYMVHYKGEPFFALTLPDLAKQVPASAMNQAMHLKGLGEINADVLHEMAFNIGRRTLTRLTEVSRKDLSVLSDLMGTENSARKKLLGVD